MPEAAAEFRAGRLVVGILDGDLRRLCFAGREVLRRVSYPVRDADWGTLPMITTSEEMLPTGYLRAFADPSGLFRGTFRLHAESEALLRLSVRFEFHRAMQANRVGFAVLHPLAEVAGTALTVTRPDGTRHDTLFPSRISPGQPAKNIARLQHLVGEVAVDLTFAGEVFEMEDQRNWSDASFKTYCRPLADPRPFAVAAGEVIRQDITLRLQSQASTRSAAPAPETGTARLPQVVLAHEAGLSTLAALAEFPDVPVLARLDRTTPDSDLTSLARRSDVAVEIVFDDLAGLSRQSARLEAAGLRPVRLTGLPRSYLASHQPTGPWPEGPAPRDAIAPLRAAFAAVPVGSGSLTNFTEYNRCPPDAAADFATFGNSAIVHAADDLSVQETLEALPAIFATAQALIPGKPLHLGLFSIGMRSNPYGRDVVANPGLARLPMARLDPRQGEGFAAAYALGILMSAARAGVASIALAMPDGPLGAAGTPLGALIRAAARAAGQEVRWTQTGNHIRLQAPGLDLAATGPCMSEGGS